MYVIILWLTRIRTPKECVTFTIAKEKKWNNKFEEAREKDIWRKKHKIDGTNRKHWLSQTQKNSYYTAPLV